MRLAGGPLPVYGPVVQAAAEASDNLARPVFAVSVIAIMLFQVAALFARSLLQRELAAGGWPPQAAADGSYLLVPPLLLVLMLPYLRRCRQGLRTLLRPADLTWRTVLAALAIAVLLRLAYWGGVIGFAGAGGAAWAGAGPPAELALAFQCPPWPALLLGLAVMVLLVPLTEEVVHRGFLLHALLPRGRVPAVLVSAALFAILHNTASLPAAFAGGVVLAVQLLNGRTLWGPLVSHAAYNALAVVDWRCLSVSWNPPTGEAAALLAAAWSIPGALACLLLAFFLAGRKAAGTGPRRPHGSERGGNPLDHV